MEVVKWDEELNDKSWLKFCAVGVLKSFSDVSPVFCGLRERKIQASMRYFGDKNTLLLLNSINDREIFISNRLLWKGYFSSVGIWSDTITPQTRLPCVEFRGFPLNVWCEEFFIRLGEDLVLVSEEWISRRLGSGQYGPASSRNIGQSDGFEKQQLSRQKFMIVLGSKTSEETAINGGFTKEKGGGIQVAKLKGVDLDGDRAGDWEDGGSSRSSSNEDNGKGLLNIGSKLAGESSKAREGQINGGNFYIDLGLGQVKGQSFKEALLKDGNIRHILDMNKETLVSKVHDPVNSAPSEGSFSSSGNSISHISETQQQVIERPLDKSVEERDTKKTLGSPFVKNISKLYYNDHRAVNIVKEGFQVVMGSGEKVRLWQDVKWDSMPFMRAFSRIYALASNKSCVVSDFGSWVDLDWVWNVRKFLDDNTMAIDPFYDFLWQGLCPPKIEGTTSGCPMCGGGTKSIDHGFLVCDWSNKVWRTCMGWWDVNVCSSSSVKGWVLGWNTLCPLSSRKRMWNILFFAIVWTVWECRNEVVFHGLVADQGKALDMIKFRVALLFKNHGRGSDVDLTMLMLDLKDRCVDTCSAKANRIKAWIPPDISKLCFYVDGSSRVNPGDAGIGGVLWDCNGNILSLFSYFVGGFGCLFC
ncbi:hypothetical protein Dsin_029899 [Dipteronia sinensis]|uniref:DUF4283 domain-containing protein n=1 Tax=Dipteronia sinensis TaxID=43782 RepID=A0AAD9ZTG8_9ROSI|nr:hypothetical protein Dsin_029899 [Dipteronia sinensis]